MTKLECRIRELKAELVVLETDHRVLTQYGVEDAADKRGAAVARAVDYAASCPGEEEASRDEVPHLTASGTTSPKAGSRPAPVVVQLTPPPRSQQQVAAEEGPPETEEEEEEEEEGDEEKTPLDRALDAGEIQVKDLIGKTVTLNNPIDNRGLVFDAGKRLEIGSARRDPRERGEPPARVEFTLWAHMGGRKIQVRGMTTDMFTLCGEEE